MVQHADIDHTGLTGTGSAAVEVAKVATAQTTASTSFADLATVGPSVTVTVPASGKVRVSVACRVSNSGANDSYVGITLSGANTVAGTTVLIHNGTTLQQFGATTVLTGLTPGATTIKLQYAVAAGTGTFELREVSAQPVS